MRACDDIAPTEVKPTREGGKGVIDYGRYGGKIHVVERGQHKGVGDHHLVTYTLQCGQLEDTRAWQLRRQMQDRDQEVDPEDWQEDIWLSKYHRRYAQAKSRQDTHDMWRCLSDAAEDALCEAESR